MHDSNCVITLTYSVAPEGLVKHDFQLFMKRLRKRISPQKVRFLACGEYGDKFSRPHFHAGLFGWCPPDMTPFSGKYRSAFLESLWPAGFSLVDHCSFDAFAYIARYMVKKVLGKGADAHYLDSETGEYRTPEFLLCSRRPGVGRTWLEKFGSDAYPSGFMYDFRGGITVPPRYFNSIVKKYMPSLYEESLTHHVFRPLDIWALDSQELNTTGRLNLKGSRNLSKE